MKKIDDPADTMAIIYIAINMRIKLLLTVALSNLLIQNLMRRYCRRQVANIVYPKIEKNYTILKGLHKKLLSV